MSVDSERASHARYRVLEQIGRGGMGEVFRAHDRLTSQLVALKRIRLPFLTAPAAGNGNTLLGKAATVAAEIQPPLPTIAPDQGLAGKLAAPPAVENAVWVAPGIVDAFAAASSSQVQTLRLHLAQEFHTLAGLRHPHIVSVLDYGFARDHQPYFTMELLEKARPLDEALQSAVLYRMPFDEALVHQALADLAYTSGERRLAIEERRRAAALFTRVGATFYVSQVS